MNQQVPTNSVIEVVEEGDTRRLFIAGEERFVGHLDPGDDTCTYFEIKESDLGKIRGSDLQRSVVLMTSIFGIASNPNLSLKFFSTTSFGKVSLD